MGLFCSCNHVQNPSKDGGGVGGGEAEDDDEEEEEIIESSCFFCACTACLNIPRTKKDVKHPSTAIASSSTGSSSATFQSDHMIKSSLWSESSVLSLGTSDQDYSGELSLPPDLRKFSFADLKAATRNFRPDSILGEGGFGCVFKGWIHEHTSAPAKPGTGLTVAVKILNQLGMQGHKEWMTEIIYLGQLRHPNLVRLFGFCIEGDHRLLVYEFIQRGSLNNHLFQKRGSSLPWNTRMKIMLGSARGVEFLHSRKNPIIYRDFKASNILLDKEFEAKLSDFGLAKDGPQGNKTHVSTRVMGTEGYAAPEYVLTGHLSVKSDVYSFGVVLLEILTGKPVLDENRPNGEKKLVPWALPYLNDKQKILEIVDPRLEGQYSTTGAQRLGRLSLRCVGRDPRSRPTMGYIVERLEKLQD